MEKYRGYERRRHPRVQSSIVASYHMEDEINNFDLSQSVNVSRGGMLLTTNRKFYKGTRLGMTILFPFLNSKAHVVAEVVDSTERVEGVMYETRLRFRDLGRHILQGFDSFIGENR